MEYNDEDVKRMVKDDLEAVKAAGGTPEDLANKFKSTHDRTSMSALDILRDAVQDVFGEQLPLWSDDLEKQPQAGPSGLSEKDAQAFQQASQDPEWVEKYNKALKNNFEYDVEELKNNPDYADYLKNSEEQKRVEALPDWNHPKQGFLKNKKWSSKIAAGIASKQAVLRGDPQPSLLPDPTGEPTSGPDTSKTYSSPEEGIEQNTEELADLFNQRIENPEDIDVANEMDSILMDIFQDDSLVTAITETPPEDFKNAQQYIDSLKDAAEHTDESKQPFREQYNRLFESLGGI
jgi:hypothetical protein